ncbi:MAG: response regulator [Alphaproteobacteria bacterium]|nr:response regulator [Alphaproteobacteria bacterium]
MSLAKSITPHIPYLRRFARALTGTQSSGDAYVQATIEALVEDPSSFPDDMDARCGLFSVYLRIWNSVDVNKAGIGDTGNLGDGIVERRLASLTPISRQAFLLVFVEEFSQAEAAGILQKSLEELEQLLAQAATEMAEQIATCVLIIEDEPLIAIDIEDIVESLGHTSIGVARTRQEAVALGKVKTPGLVLADIQLADGSSGIDAVNDLLRQFNVPVIFITAYPERLLTGDRPEPTFLMTKPFQPEMLKAVISQALFFEQAAALKDAS